MVKMTKNKQPNKIVFCVIVWMYPVDLKPHAVTQAENSTDQIKMKWHPAAENLKDIKTFEWNNVGHIASISISEKLPDNVLSQ